MYIHLGWNEIVQGKDVLAVCSYESWAESDINREMLEMARVAGTLRSVGQEFTADDVEEIRSVVICSEEVILSPITSSTLQRRVDRDSALGVSTGIG